MGNPFVHIELNTTNVAKAKKFYKTLFDWKLGPMGPGYTGIDVGRGTGGGMQKKPMPDAPTQWLPYIEVDDVLETVAKAKRLGAKIHVPFMEIGDMGAIGVFTDPTGASVGVWAKEVTKKSPKKSTKKKRK